MLFVVVGIGVFLHVERVGNGNTSCGDGQDECGGRWEGNRYNSLSHATNSLLFVLDSSEILSLFKVH